MKDPAITCAKCGKALEYDVIDLVCLWANIRCECGSQLWNIRVDSSRSHCQLYGVSA